jgi:hypothetical protein
MGLIYRIENDDGLGPYQGRKNDDTSLLPMKYSTEHPAVWDDSMLINKINQQIRIDAEGQDEYKSVGVWGFIDGKYHFGFGSQDQLRRWVYNDAWMVNLDKHGFHLSVYEVPEMAMMVGHTQAIFQKSFARQKYRCKLCDFFAIPTE